MYRETNNQKIVRIADGAVIPAVGGNNDYRDYLAWLNAGGVPEPAEPDTATARTMSRRQFFRALHAMEISETSVQAIVDLAPVEVQIDYKTFTEAREDDASLTYVFAQLGRPPADLTTFFNIGAQL